MAKTIAWTAAAVAVSALLQSTLLAKLFIYIHAVPDIALDVLVFSAYLNGMMAGQLSGFCSGLLLDFLSSAPLGLNVFVRTLTGAVSGRLRESVNIDGVFLPMVLCAGATLLKAGLLFALNWLLGADVPVYSLAAPALWAELALNAVLAPPVFALLKKLNRLLGRRIQ